MNLLRTFSRLLAVCGSSVFFFCLPALAADDLGIVDTPSVVDLRAEATATNVTLTWPSDSRESFVVLWRSNATYRAQWIVLTNQMRAGPKNRTIFFDTTGLTRIQGDAARTNLLGLYSVYLIPDFWFDMQGVTLCGGPKIFGEDFLPFYYDLGGAGSPQQNVGLVVDGEEAGWGIIHVERVNFGTVQKPRWIDAWGFWFKIDLLTNGEHTLQLRSMLSLNDFVGDWSQTVFLTNKPGRIRILVNGEKSNRNSWWDQRLGHDFPVPQTTEEYAEKFLHEERNPLKDKIPSRPLNLESGEINAKSSGMILDLGEVSHRITITPEYSNAVLSAVLPYFSDVAKKLDLPVTQPITPADVAGFHVLPFREMTCSMLLKDGSVFDFHFGFMSRYLSPQSVDHLQPAPNTVLGQKHQPAITQDEAIEIARNAIKKLSIPLEDVFAEQKPRVAVRKNSDATNAVPHYEIQWIDPRGSGQIIGEVNAETEKTALVTSPAVDIEINGETKQIEKIKFALLKSLRRLPPKINITPVASPDWPSVNPEYARQLVQIIFKAVDDYAQKLSLPIPRPLTTNNVARAEIHDNEGWPHAEIELTNGWRFVYRHTMVNGYYAPDNLFASDNRPIHIEEFEGKWNLTTNQAIELVRKTLTKLDYPTNNIHMDFAPNIIPPAGDFKKIIPRYFFEWYYENAAHDDLQSRLEAEVDANSGKLESFYYDDKAYWGSRPPIDVPISIKN